MYLPDNEFTRNCGQSGLSNTIQCKSCESVRKQKGSRSFLRLAFRLFGVFLAGILILSCVSASIVHAELVTNAKVSVTSANVRSAPGTTATTVVPGAKLPINTRVAAGEVVTGEIVTGYGDQWCKISVIVSDVQYDGYIVNAFLQKDPTTNDPAFEAAIAGFPESYKQSLRSLHEAHTAWIFNAVNLEVDWSTAVNEESRTGRSLIETIGIPALDDSWKSIQADVYDWRTGYYINGESGNLEASPRWVNTTSDVVAYYMDPRNFLSETQIFQFLNLNYDPTTQTQEAVQNILNNSFMTTSILDPNGNPTSYATAFMDAALQSGASPYFLISRAIQEVQTFDASNRKIASGSASGTYLGYEGYFNFYNIQATGPTPVEAGLKFAQTGYTAGSDASIKNAKYLLPWNSQYVAIVGGAKWITNGFFTAGQNTMYYQKFDVINDVATQMYWHQYMQNIQAPVSEAKKLFSAYASSESLNLPLSFDIPIYSNIPEAAIALPTKTGNPNNWLAQLSINEGYTLTPTFDAAITDGYSLIVPNQVSVLNLTASSVSSKASISGVGAIALNVGENVVNISVTAENGSIRTYVINIVRNEQTGEALFTTNYRINTDNTLAGFLPGSTLATFSQGFISTNDGQFVFLNPAGTIISDSAHSIATGDRIQVLNASLTPVYDFVLLVYGDANCDGKISSSDLTVISRYVLKQSILSGGALLAADANHDSKISSSDLTIVSRHVLKQSNIVQ